MRLAYSGPTVNVMERETIVSKTQTVPISELGKVPYDVEIWEQTDGGAHFKFTRHYLPVLAGLEVAALTVIGEISERHRVIAEFCEVFGLPLKSEVDRSMSPNINTVMWLWPKARPEQDSWDS